MCLISLAWQSHPSYSLILVANRDEYHARPSLPIHHWEGAPEITGGKDLQAGGSWLAVSSKGRFATVTNFREGIPEPARLSRGALIREFLLSAKSPEQFNQQLAQNKHLYGGFNLLLGDESHLFYCSNRSNLATNLNPGIYSLSNHLLDTPWPKADYAKQQLTELLKQDQISTTRLIQMMQNADQFDDALLPYTGVGLERERTLSPPFIISDDYGTRCTTVMLWRRDRKIELVEQNYHADGSEGERLEHLISLD